jgi:transglutaminase-like putative cysteine protease
MRHLADSMRRRMFLALTAAPLVLGASSRASARATDGPQVFRQLRFQLAFSNPTASPLLEQVFWAYVPLTSGSYQRLTALSVSMPHALLEDELGHRIVELRFPRLGPLETKMVSMRADITMLSGRIDVRPPADGQWLASERYIESDDSRIIRLGAELRGVTAFDTASNIFSWVSTNIRYAGFVADDFGARFALQHGGGDCTEFAYLATALARANGLPARMVGGFVADRIAAPRPEDYHNWAEVFFDGAWWLLDAQKGRWARSVDDYIAFRYHAAHLANPIGAAHRYRIAGDMSVAFGW